MVDFISEFKMLVRVGKHPNIVSLIGAALSIDEGERGRARTVGGAADQTGLGCMGTPIHSDICMHKHLHTHARTHTQARTDTQRTHMNQHTHGSMNTCMHIHVHSPVTQDIHHMSETTHTIMYIRTYVYTHHTLTHRNVRICAQLARTCKLLIHRHTHARMRSNKHTHTYSPLFNLSSPPLILSLTQNNSSFLWSLHPVVISSPI